MTSSTTPSYSSSTGYTGSAGGSTGVAFDFSPFFDRMATALETIATNSTTIATNSTTIATNSATVATKLTNINLDIDIITKLADGAKEFITTISAGISGDINQKVITTSSDTSSIVVGQLVTGTGIPSGTFVTAFDSTSVTLSKNLTTAASGTYSFYKSWSGIHTIGPYDWLGLINVYRSLIEQGSITDINGNVSEIEQAAAFDLVNSYITKIKNFPTSFD